MACPITSATSSAAPATSSNRAPLRQQFPRLLTLSRANTYTGVTTIQTGTLSLGSTGSLASSRIQVNSGAIFAVNPAGTTIRAGQTLSGSGTVTGPITIAGTISPGNSPGILTTAAETWDGGGTYVWELNSATGSAGTNWDLLNIGGTLTINSSLANPFVIDVRSLGFDNLAGLRREFRSQHDLHVGNRHGERWDHRLQRGQVRHRYLRLLQRPGHEWLRDLAKPRRQQPEPYLHRRPRARDLGSVLSDGLLTVAVMRKRRKVPQ